MDIEDTRKGIYLFKGNGSFLKELIPLSHIIVVRGGGGEGGGGGGQIL